MDTWREWQKRKQVLDAALKLLGDGQRRSGRQIARELTANGFEAEKSLVNSVLFSEGRRYVTYNRNSYTYQIRGEPFVVEPAQQNGTGPSEANKELAVDG